ncbi:MAG: PTS transporter subunit EIIC [Eubacteriales bacterium]|nr:PTS transporter subunit EIIC [Eubacteriales bacterium]
MKYAHRLGKALMLPVACLPVAGLLMGLGYWVESMGSAELYLLSQVMVKAGSALMDHMSILFTLGVAMGMADEQDGASVLAGAVSWMMIQNVLSPANVVVLTQGRLPSVPFEHIDNQLIGILCGLIGAHCCNRYRHRHLSGALAIFGGRRLAVLASCAYAAVASLVLLFVWPTLYGGCVYIGESMIGAGALGAGIYGFLNRLLIPTGFHHALNSIFWFDMAGISDLNNFWNGTGVYGQTGMYMTGFFPVMIFGMPGAALAMYHTARTEKRKMAGGLLLTASLCSVLTGVTEPLEFSFMFLAPELFLLHAFLTGLSAFVCAALPFRVGFNFSAGLLDYLLSLNAPLAENPWLLWPVGLGFGCLYYLLFRFCIQTFRLPTPGREKDAEEQT